MQSLLLQKEYLQSELRNFEQGEKGDLIKAIKNNNHGISFYFLYSFFLRISFLSTFDFCTDNFLENGTCFTSKDGSTNDFLKCYAWICSSIRTLNARIMVFISFCLFFLLVHSFSCSDYRVFSLFAFIFSLLKQN